MSRSGCLQLRAARFAALVGCAVAVCGMSLLLAADDPPEVKSTTKTGRGVAAQAPASTGRTRSQSAERSSKTRTPATKTETPNRSANVGRTSDRPKPAEQQLVLDFVGAHHAEMATLLKRLRQKSRTEFFAAVKELHPKIERLERWRSNDDARYAIELDAWKLDSRIRLLAARLAMSNDPEIQAQIRDVIRQRTEVRKRQLQLERDRTRQRLEKLEQVLSSLSEDPETAINKDLERILRMARNRSRQPSPDVTNGRSKAPTKSNTREPKSKTGNR